MNRAIQLSTALQSFVPDERGDWAALVRFARMADQAGFDRLVISDHVVFGEDLDAYGDPRKGGATGGRQPTGPDGAWLDPIITIAHLTAVTSRVRFGTNILLAALRRPVVLAKMASTIDVLSGGRLDIGVGVGWQREEYEAAGLDFDERGRLLNHTLEVCQALWTERRVSYQSEELAFQNIHQMPKPLQEGGVPIWVSGRVNARSMQRLARFGTGWIPWGEDAADIVGGIARMRAAVEGFGRDPSELGVVGTLREYLDDAGGFDRSRTMEQVPGLAEAGVTDFRIRMRLPDDEAAVSDRLHEVAEAFRAAAT
ncbi:MAG: TIGR03619 family F420-dependent LLM class oxidoreductase [Acidobacteriota bacterium]|nr:TIGR03619 family F420-dependent LLM class oxidoreductase [Acidobacteriota bacterium]